MNSLTERTRSFWPRGLAWFVDVAVASHARAVALLVVVSLLAFLPGLTRIPPVDREEARFAQAAKQMVESGDYIDIRFQDDVRYSKPVGIYWLQAAVVKTADSLGVRRALTRISLYRIPSLLGGVGAVLITYWTALAFVSRRGAIVAGLILSASVLVGVFARLATTDAMLLFSVAAAMGAMARAYRGQYARREGKDDWIVPGIFWTALAAGFLLKGPLILLFVGLTIASLAIVDRSARWLADLRPLPGLIWFFVLVLPWFLAIISRSGRFFFLESVGHDLLGRIVNIQEYRFVPPGFYLVTFFGTFWPASLLAGLAAPAVWANRHAAPTRFLLAWLVPAWLLFEIILTKLPHFVLPLYPAVAILIAGCIETFQLSRRRWMEYGTFWFFAVPVLVALGSVVMLIRVEGSLGFFAWPFAAAAVVFGFRAWWLYDADGAERSLLRACAASVFLAIAVYSFVLPGLSSMFPSALLARVMRDANCANPEVAAAGYHEPSLVFLTGTPTQLTDGAGAAEFLRRGGCRFAFIESRHQRSFAQRADALGLRYARGPGIDAMNIPRGQTMSIAIFRSEERP